MRSGLVCRPWARWWLGLLAPACLLLASCAAPVVSPSPDVPAEPPGETAPASEPAPADQTAPAREPVPAIETVPASGAVERSPGGQADVNETDAGQAGQHEDGNVNGINNRNRHERGSENPQRQREQLEHRLREVVACLEDARQAVVAAEIAGAGIEAVRPAIDALHRSEAALREAQAQLIRGEAGRAASPLETAEAECRAARELGRQVQIPVIERPVATRPTPA